MYYNANFGNNDNCSALGLGIGVPLLFNEKLVHEGVGERNFLDPDVYSYLTVVPSVAAEYGIVGSLFCIRADAHFGKLYLDIASFGYYAGVSGLFLKNFADGTVAFGISPSISLELYMILLGFRVQAQYDFYTVEQYNQFSITIALTAIVFGSGF